MIDPVAASRQGTATLDAVRYRSHPRVGRLALGLGITCEGRTLRLRQQRSRS